MIEYDYRFIYTRLKSKGYTLDFLRENKVISQSTLQHLRHNKQINTSTINILCALMECTPQDFMRYTRQKSDLEFINSMEEIAYGMPVSEGTDEADPEKRKLLPWPKTVH